MCKFVASPDKPSCASRTAICFSSALITNPASASACGAAAAHTITSSVALNRVWNSLGASDQRR